MKTTQTTQITYLHSSDFACDTRCASPCASLAGQAESLAILAAAGCGEHCGDGCEGYGSTHAYPGKCSLCFEDTVAVDSYTVCCNELTAE
jgi:hypothetical protein